ncbi:ATP-dependent rRNA helicase SPB4 [Frankliniella fusca]|uniref:ATP-dependent rRNA helicase SPB4 n=1 Tax=Frankliniella fusca TaxID=407009 RepID=A0AAE1HAD5_9NEOP|nr:ATP-dependent rRNA helicase SPB4 [Frankliniella fusca]
MTHDLKFEHIINLQFGIKFTLSDADLDHIAAEYYLFKKSHSEHHDSTSRTRTQTAFYVNSINGVFEFQEKHVNLKLPSLSLTLSHQEFEKKVIQSPTNMLSEPVMEADEDEEGSEKVTDDDKDEDDDDKDLEEIANKKKEKWKGNDVDKTEKIAEKRQPEKNSDTSGNEGNASTSSAKPERKRKRSAPKSGKSEKDPSDEDNSSSDEEINKLNKAASKIPTYKSIKALTKFHFYRVLDLEEVQTTKGHTVRAKLEDNDVVDKFCYVHMPKNVLASKQVCNPSILLQLIEGKR